jgi:hypothetical protein
VMSNMAIQEDQTRLHAIRQSERPVTRQTCDQNP